MADTTVTAQDWGKLLLRFTIGGIMLAGHGWGKLMMYGELQHSFPDPLGIGSTLSLLGAISGEALAAALIVIGLFTRLAAVPLIFTMAVAAFVVHSGDPLFSAGGPAKEPALIFMLGAISIALLGPGKLSLDTLLAQRRSARSA